MVNNILIKREFTLASSWEAIRDKAEANLEKFLRAFE
jgi:hypothetical protein